jgi:MtN3 and saliva related transmembrane protein
MFQSTPFKTLGLDEKRPLPCYSHSCAEFGRGADHAGGGKQVTAVSSGWSRRPLIIPSHESCFLQWIPQSSPLSKAPALFPSIELVGSVAATITTFAWLPQISKILRDRQATDISWATTGALAAGVVLWVVYGVFIGSWPVILSNVVTFLFIATILGLKWRYG